MVTTVPATPWCPSKSDLVSLPRDLDDAPDLLEVHPQVSRLGLEGEERPCVVSRNRSTVDCSIQCSPPKGTLDHHSAEAQSIYTCSPIEHSLQTLRMDCSSQSVVHLCGMMWRCRNWSVEGWTVEGRIFLPQDRVQVACRSLPMVFLERSTRPMQWNHPFVPRNTVPHSITWRRPGCSRAPRLQTLCPRRQQRHHCTGPSFGGQHASGICLSLQRSKATCA